jgi:hypothetical protein
MEDPSPAFLDAVRKSMREIRATIGATTINPHLSLPPSESGMKAT